MAGRRIEKSLTPPAETVEQAVIVWVLWQLPDAQELIADPDVIVHGEFAPGLQADIGSCGIVIAEGDIRLADAPQGRARDRLLFGVEDLDVGIERRTEAAGVDFQNEWLSLPGAEAPAFGDSGSIDPAVRRAGDRQAKIAGRPGRRKANTDAVLLHRPADHIACRDDFRKLASADAGL